MIERISHECAYHTSDTGGPVIRFLALRPAVEIMATTEGVSLCGHWHVYTDEDAVHSVQLLLDWAWNAHQAIGASGGDHDAAKKWVRVHNALLKELREIKAAEIGNR